MNTAINQLLDVDREARMILDEAQQYYDKTLADLAAEKKRLLEQYEKKAADHLSAVGHTEHKSVAEETAALEQRHREQIAALDAVFASEHENWESELFRRSLGR